MAAILTLLDIEQARQFYEKGYWRSDTLYGLLRSWADRFPERFALRDTNSRLTYRGTLQWVDAVAADLHAAGVRPGDRVSLWLPSRIESAILILACSRMGYVCNTSLHRDYTCADIVNLLKRARTSAFFGQPNYGADSERNDVFVALKDVDSLKKVYRLDPLRPDPSTADLPARFGGITPAPATKLPWSASPDRVVYLAFTSGTTGQPKGVMHTDNTLLANGRAIVKDWNFDQDTIIYSLSPMSHNIGMVALVVTMASGGELVMHTPQDAKRTLDRIIETQATYLLGVPTHALDLVDTVKRRRLPLLGSVRTFQIGGSSVPASLVRDLRELGVTVQNAFGMTENCSFQYTRPGDSLDVIANSCGRPCDGLELTLWREDNPDEMALPGESGEMGVRGACLMVGYFDDQANTEAAFNRHGWFMTGDLGRFDASGNLQVIGRKKDVIIRGGHNIFPARIEGMVLQHDAVLKAAVFPVPDKRLGECACLSVILRERGALGPADLLRFLAEQGLSRYDLPEYYCELDEFPLTPSGKVLKREMVAMVGRGDIAPEYLRKDKQPE